MAGGLSFLERIALRRKVTENSNNKYNTSTMDVNCLRGIHWKCDSDTCCCICNEKPISEYANKGLRTYTAAEFGRSKKYAHGSLD